MKPQDVPARAKGAVCLSASVPGSVKRVSAVVQQDAGNTERFSSASFGGVR